MYNDTLKVANKIITSNDLEAIFQKMFEEMQVCEKQYQKEKLQNERYEREYQNWTLKDYSATFKVSVNFYDATEISFDKFSNFMTIFNTRLDEIKNFYLRYSCSYIRKKQGCKEEYVSQSIYMDVYENKMNIDIKLNSDDNIMNEVYETIKQRILYAPEKFDEVIKNKSSICNKVAFARGFIPTSILLFLLIFVETIREIYVMSYVAFPFACIIFSYTIGNTIFGGKIEELYKNISPEKKYAGYDSKNYNSIYKDDIDKYVESSEILIGKNVNNLRDRKEIIELDKKYSGYIKYEIIALIAMSILVVVIGRFI